MEKASNKPKALDFCSEPTVMKHARIWKVKRLEVRLSHENSSASNENQTKPTSNRLRPEIVGVEFNQNG